MAEDSFKPIPLECVLPDIFPAIALYTKGSGANYVLYKPFDRPFTLSDQQRLERTGKQNIYVQMDDSVDLTSYIEEHLTAFLADDSISEKSKNLILYQTSMEFVAEVMESPHGLSSNIGRCKSLIKNLMKHVASSAALLDVFQEIAADKLYILSHSVKVAALTMLVHDKAFNISPDEMLDVGVGGILHDIGMTMISGDILEKPEALSNIEYEIVKTHPQKGYELLNNAGCFNEISLTIVRHHHEKWDGSGYPARLKGDNITRSAQVAAICDIYCALVSERPYRKASPHPEALRIMKDEAGRTFKKELFDTFEKIVNKQTLQK
ncbi:cyclic di-GMP phosphodiesterase response regulator RpfG [Geobacter sp. OR-1]|uniref:HD-GYP domain-containing protein n=1 Tax=Geobacter sp. OR-1 TaxID=1266765 RepID=UPI0005421490|nr:HD domain-containing phosphohydrolase [Geobacter sp. OR-1]GAM10886.1 cyclic di-GMP phosphodiesterase response regulator RpfG [Geobacter sp. OR-1]